MLKRLILFTLLLTLTLVGIADETKPVEAGKGILKGFVFDENATQPLEYATISLVSKESGQVLDGTITDKTGFFKLKNVDFGQYKIEITFIGYNTQTFDNIVVERTNREIDLGQVVLQPAVEEISEAVVVADRPTMTYKIDKKVINVSQQHTSASGTAVEILENIPSVTVDIEGNVSLRGSESFTVLIDGKPTVLDPSDALSQIPASAIDNIEVITNPSAKYDPDGTSGIINIITKKNKLQGFNGIVNLNAGMYDRYGADFLLNWRKERLNLFFGADINNRNMEGTMETENRTIAGDTTSYIISDGDFLRGRESYSFRGGFDWTFNPRNSINFEVRAGYRDSKRDYTTDYQEYTIPATVSYNYISEESSTRGGWFYNYNLSYTHKFMKKGHQLYTLLNYRTSDSDEESMNELFDLSDILTSGQKSYESGPGRDYRVQMDYTLPLRVNDKFEAGYILRIDDSDELSELEEYNPVTQIYEYMDDYRNDVDHYSEIHAVYSTYSGEIGSFGYQGGLRGEYTYRDISIEETGQASLIDRFDIFPTIHVSYNTPKENQFMASYSRRIQRPRGWYLEPFITWSDAYNVRRGNPDLLPEYIDSYELSSILKFGQNTFSVDAYYRITNNKIERIRSKYEERDNVFLSTYENVGKDYSLGVELMLGVEIAKWWHLDLMGNIYDYKVEGEYEYVSDGETRVADFSESSFNWNSRLNNTIRLGKSTRLQLNGMYNSPTVSAQGEREGFFMTNIALRQSFLKNKIAATLQVRDVFGTMSHSSTYEGDGFYSWYDFQPNTPLVSLTLSFKINNYKPDRRGGGQAGDDLGGEESGF
ncbi:MAG: TonB-dependent receptor [Bacteroidetes bacterium]|nr:TonB-dependent receptor [Bacteroidota bacterium]